MTSLSPLPTTAFTATRVAFDRALAKQSRGGASVSATLNGREVLTLVGGEARAGASWTADTRTVTMSVAKGWAGLVMAMLADRGLVDPEERVAAYWPEFAAAGKGSVTLRHLLLHTSGVIGLPDVAATLGWDGRGWEDLDAIAAALAAATPAWEPGTQTGYHAVTYGWLLGEVVRRTDGRSLGAFFREEVAQPLGIRTSIGVPRGQQGDLAYVHSEGMDTAPLPVRRILRKAREGFRDPSTLLGMAGLGDGTLSVFDNGQDFLNSGAWLASEVPSSNGVTSARDLARLFAAVACGGELDGVRLLSSATLTAWSAPQPGSIDVVTSSALGPVARPLLARQLTVDRSLAFMTNQAGKALGPGRSSVGAGGYGGQLVFADPEAQLSFAFVRSGLQWTQKEVTQLVNAVYEDLGKAPR